MTREPRPSKVVLEDNEATNNRGDGFRIGTGVDAELKRNRASGNKGDGFSVGEASGDDKRPWYKQLLGKIALGIFVAVVAGGVLHFLGWV